MNSLPTLSPTQRRVADNLAAALASSSYVTLRSWQHPGSGVSTIVRTLQAELGGCVVDYMDLAERTGTLDPKRYETALFDLIAEAFETHDIVYVDNVRLTSTDYYSRWSLNHLGSQGQRWVAERTGKKLLMVGGAGGTTVQAESLDAGDYRHILEQVAPGSDFSTVDFGTVKFVAGSLNAPKLIRLARLLEGDPEPSTAEVIAKLPLILQTTVDLGHVEELDFSDLKGAEALIERLDRSVLLPYKNPELARELGVTPKHGVLLYGPPGMGKTSIGRALAHEMRGKFFLLDGDYDHETMGCFFKKVRSLFEAARRSAPSVIFIDDADVILGDPRMQQWGRYLLTMLDGLKSDDSGKVCVMMTAMNLADMPPALLRSGRLEVWLKLTPPEGAARQAILDGHLQRLPFKVGPVELSAVVERTAGLSPADLRRVVSDATGFLALDRQNDRTEQGFDIYLHRSVDAILAQKAVAKTAFALA